MRLQHHFHPIVVRRTTVRCPKPSSTLETLVTKPKQIMNFKWYVYCNVQKRLCFISLT